MSGPWVRTTAKRGIPDVYHTDPDCQRFPEKSKEAPEQLLPLLRECEHCADEPIDKSKTNWTAYNAAVEAGKKDSEESQ